MTLPSLVLAPPAPPPAARGRIQEVDLLRALCCRGVLLIHISGFYWAQPAKDPSLRHLLVFVITNEAVRYALFGFMFISGLLLTVRHGGQFHAASFLGKRVRTVLVPYLAWVVLYLGIRTVSDTVPVTQFLKALHGSFPHIKIVMSWVLFGSWQHLYFINMLFQMYVLYAMFQRPISRVLARPRTALLLVCALALLYPLWVYFRFVPYRHPEIELPHLLLWMTKNANRLAFEWLVPFTMGLAVGAYYQQFLAWVQRHRRIVLLGTCGALAVTVTIAASPWFTAHQPGELMNYGWPRSYIHPIFRLLYACGLNCLVLCTTAQVMERLGGIQPRWLLAVQRFAAVSFGIYLFHPVLLDLLRRIPCGTRGFSFVLYAHSPVFYLLFTTAVVTGLSYWAVEGVRRMGVRWPRAAWVYTLLFGR